MSRPEGVTNVLTGIQQCKFRFYMRLIQIKERQLNKNQYVFDQSIKFSVRNLWGLCEGGVYDSPVEDCVVTSTI